MNVQPYSGSETTFVVYQAVPPPYGSGNQMSYGGLVAHLWNIAKYNLPLIIHQEVMVQILQCGLMVHCGWQVTGGAEGIHPLLLIL